MATDVKKHVITGSHYKRDFVSETLTEHHQVSGLTIGETARLRDATFAKSNQSEDVYAIPEIGSEHPSRPGFICVDIDAKPEMTQRTNNINVTITWVNFVPGAGAGNEKQLVSVMFNGTQLQQLTSFDASSKMINVPYIEGASNRSALTPPEVSSTGDGWKWDYVKLPKMTPGAVLTFNYRSRQSPMWYSIGPDGFPMAGRTNRSRFQGQPAGEWLCLPVAGRSLHPIYYRNIQNGQLLTGLSATSIAWEVSLSFEWRPPAKVMPDGQMTGGPGWEPLCVFHDPRLGSTPSDVNPLAGGYPNKRIGNGWRVAKLYATASFEWLNLPEVLG